MHLTFKFLKNIPVSEESVCKQAIESSDNYLQVGLRRLRNRDAGRKRAAVVGHCSRIIKGVNHVVDCRTLLVVCMIGTQEHVVFSGSHFLTFIARANAEQLYNQ